MSPLTGLWLAGTHDVQKAVAGRIKDHIPYYLSQLEDQSSLQPGSISAPQSKTNPAGLIPKHISIYPQDVQLEQIPAIFVVSDGIGKVTLRQVNQTHPALVDENTPPDGEQFDRSYRVRLWAYVVNQDHASVIESRNRLELAVWRTLMDGRMLANNAYIDKNSYVSSNSGVDKTTGVENSSLIAGFVANVSVNVSETLTTIALGSADTILIEEFLMPIEEGS